MLGHVLLFMKRGDQLVWTSHSLCACPQITLVDVMDTATEGAADRMSDAWAVALPPTDPWQASGKAPVKTVTSPS